MEIVVVPESARDASVHTRGDLVGLRSRQAYKDPRIATTFCYTIEALSPASVGSRYCSPGRFDSMAMARSPYQSCAKPFPVWS